MKLISLFLFLSLVHFSFAQNNVYTITEKFDGIIGFVPSYDSVFVTNPQGVTTKYNIPNYIGNTAAHDSQFNQILNGILSQGYKIIETHSEGTAVNNQLLSGNYIFVLKTYYLGQPWTTAGLLPAGVNNSQCSILNVYPNPTFSSSTVKFESKNKKATLYIVNSGGFICQEIDVSNVDEYTIDTSKLKSGTYNLILVADNYYSEAYKMVKL